MAESTLAMAYNDLVGEVGTFLGYGRGAANGDTAFTSQQQAAVDSIVKSGLRQVHNPPPLEGVTDSAYDWSFLKPVVILVLANGAQTVPLPDDYGGIEGQVTLQTTSGNLSWEPIDVAGIGVVDMWYSERPITTGRPLIVAEEPLRGTTPTQGQRKQLKVWPIADQAYNLRFQYYLLPDYINGAFPYPYGGAGHAELYRAACLMAAEEFLDDSRGVWAQKFQERLAASIGLDRRSKPQKLGYNGDRSDGIALGRRDPNWMPGATVKGVQY